MEIFAVVSNIFRIGEEPDENDVHFLAVRLASINTELSHYIQSSLGVGEKGKI